MLPSKDKGERKMLPHEINDVIGNMKPDNAKKGGGQVAAVKLSRAEGKQPFTGVPGGGMPGGMPGGMQMGGGMLPAMSGMAYGPRVVSKMLPIDPNDTSSFSINIPQAP